MNTRNRTAIALSALAGLAFGLSPALTAQSIQQRGIGQAQAAASASRSASSGAPAQRPAGSTAAPAGRTAAGAPAAAPQGAPRGASQDPAKTGERRDPFTPTIKPTTPGTQTQELVCPQGVRGIIVGQAELNGVVRTASGIIAVITTTSGGRTYFLREGQQLCNGKVLKINPDAIVFEENVIDPAGKPLKREVIKKIPGDAK